ncbi:hypothetical protein ACO0LF_03605 [Undibacterium sp. Di27W]|uniref:hypothetical protein n=1 Tax=Undibacterium sp. Di27W TaxID=3413036 RepID=UPI003BF3B5A3
MLATQPDRAALEVAYSHLQDKTKSLDDMLKVPALRLALENDARNHMRHRSQFDSKLARCGEKD